MPIPIFFTRTDTKTLDDGRILFLIRFEDREGRESSWAPRWKDLHDCYLRAAQVERQNAKKDPEGFLTVAHSILATADQRVQDAEVVYGKIERLAGGFLDIRLSGGPETLFKDLGDVVRLPVGFEMDEEWLIKHLDRRVRCLIIGGAVCRIQHIQDF